uniref:hypothetical protein n=1 Tax=Nocardioides sp. TaxID=35761 RepID=UPI0025CED52A
RLLDAGLVNGSPVALVEERYDEGQPERAAEALVQIDLEDLTRLTVAPPRPAWESGHLAARLLPDGDIIALAQQGVQVRLVRWSSKDWRRAWSVKVAEDRAVSLVASDASVAVVLQTFDRRRGFAPTLTITQYDPATGEPEDSTVVEVVDPHSAIDTGLFCDDWLAASALACGRSGGVPIAVADDGSFAELVGGPPGAVPSVIREP